jgi:hypothetical protein
MATVLSKLVAFVGDIPLDLITLDDLESFHQSWTTWGRLPRSRASNASRHFFVSVETSVRTAMMAAWGLTRLKRPMIPIYEPVYDLRVIVSSAKSTLGIDDFTPENLQHIADSSPPLPTLITYLNELPKPVV